MSEITIAKLNPIKKRKFGVLKGKIKISKHFDAPLPNEVVKEFMR